jgi:hydrophobe/amphiphile efflux-3 (HAE3) family protein
MTDFIVRYRWFIILFCYSLGILFASMIPSARTDPEIRNYVPAGMRSRAETDKIEKEFGVQDMIIILFSDTNIITTDNLRSIKKIDDGLSRLSSVSNRISPFTIRTIKGESGMMAADRLIQRIPSGNEGIKKLKERILTNRNSSEVVFSGDLTAAAITATLGNNMPEPEILHRIDSVITSNKGSTTIMTGGLPYIRKSIMTDVSKDALVIIPVALFIMLLILKISLKDWREMLMPFSVVVISTSISMGLIPLLGWKISILSLLVPIILVAVANNYGIYLVARSQEIRAKKKVTPREMVTLLTGSLGRPVLFSGLTTMAGILGLLTHSVIPARQVGVLSATGVFMALVMSLFLIPSLLFVKGSASTKKAERISKNRLFDALLPGLSDLVVKHPGKILITTGLITLIISSGILRVRIDTNQEDYFPSSHPIRKASAIINSKFGGSQTISVMVEGDIKDPDLLNRMDKLTEKLKNDQGVGNVFSISSVVREMTKAIYEPDEPEYDKIPESKEAVAQLFELYYMSGEQGDFKQLMNFDNNKAQILIRLSGPEDRVIRNVKTQIDSWSPSVPGKVTTGGYAVIMSDFARSVIRGQVSSLLFAVITVFLLLSLVFRSFRGGMTGSIPLIISIIVLFGFMGLTGIALDAATALLSSVMIGVGVDFTIQYMWCFNDAVRQGLTFREATEIAISTIGRSIIINAVSVMAGFSALIFSKFTSIRFFGYLVDLSIGTCLIGALIIIPAFLMFFKPRFIEKNLTTNYKRNYERKNDSISVTSAAFAGRGTTT